MDLRGLAMIREGASIAQSSMAARACSLGIASVAVLKVVAGRREVSAQQSKTHFASPRAACPQLLFKLEAFGPGACNRYERAVTLAFVRSFSLFLCSLVSYCNHFSPAPQSKVAALYRPQSRPHHHPNGSITRASRASDSGRSRADQQSTTKHRRSFAR